jgi:hypothetical protein
VDRRRFVFFALGAVGVLVLYLSFMALVGGLIYWDGNLSSPLRVRVKGVDLLFEQAWHYLVPVATLVLVSLTAALTGGIWIVRHPAPRGAPF